MESQTADEKLVRLSVGGSRRGPSRMSAALSGCPKSYELSYLESYRPRIEPEFRLLGSLAHDCLAYHYAPLLPSPPDWLAEPLDERLKRRLVDSPVDLIRQAKDVAKAYVSFFYADSWSPLFVEQEFSTTVGKLDPGGPYPELDDEIVTCQADLVVSGNGHNWVIDHKFMGGDWGAVKLKSWSKQVEREYLWQGMVNLHIIRQHMPVRGFYIRRAKRRLPYDFDSNLLRPNDHEYAGVPRSIRLAVKRDLELRAAAAELKDAGGLPCNFAACVGRYGACDYTDVCHASSAEKSDETLVKHFVKI